MQLKIKVYYLFTLFILVGCNSEDKVNLIDKISLKEWKLSFEEVLHKNCDVNYKRFTDTINYPVYVIEERRITSIEELIDNYISKRELLLNELKAKKELINLKNGRLNILEIYSRSDSRYIIHSEENIIFDFTQIDGGYELNILQKDEKNNYYLGKGFEKICTNNSRLLSLNLFEIYSTIKIDNDSISYVTNNIVMSD